MDCALSNILRSKETKQEKQLSPMRWTEKAWFGDMAAEPCSFFAGQQKCIGLRTRRAFGTF